MEKIKQKPTIIEYEPTLNLFLTPILIIDYFYPNTANR